MKDEQQRVSEVIDERGELGFIDLAIKPVDAAANSNSIAVRLGNGTTVFVAPEQLREIDADKYKFAGSFEDLPRNPAGQTQAATSQENSVQKSFADGEARKTDDGQIVIPLIAEEIRIGKKIVEMGGVRIHKTVREDVQTIDEPIVREHLAVERIEINKFVESAPSVRYEGDTMIVPVLEEVVVTQKRLMLREEIRLTKSREEISNPQQIVLRREEINLEKIEPDENR